MDKRDSAVFVWVIWIWSLGENAYIKIKDDKTLGVLII